nr:zinc ABC transporter substrate-binding protein [Brucepastera parasyntrophica]
MLDEDDHDDHPGHDSSILHDQHTWLGREASKIMAGHIFDSVTDLLPENSEMYAENYSALLSDIDQVFDELSVELAPLKGKTVFVFHPSFGYFFDEFGIIQEAVETGGKEPTAKNLVQLIEKAKEEKPPAIFVQKQFPVKAAETVAEAAGAKVIMLDPLAEDWLDNIRVMGNMLKTIAK